VHVAHNFNCVMDTEGLFWSLFKVTSSHVHGKSGNVSEMVKQRRCYYRLAYQTVAIAMTLNDLQGHSPADFVKWDFSYSCAVFAKISSNIAQGDIIYTTLFAI